MRLRLRHALLWAALLVPATAWAAPTARPGEEAARIAGTELLAGHAFDIVESITDRVGQRLAGSPAADRGVAWALAEMHQLGLENVHKEPVEIPRWVRGQEKAELIAPDSQELMVTALGGSIGTPPAGLTGELVEVDSIEALRALGPAVKGKIVFFDKAMERTRGFEGYGSAVGLRSHGAVEAARFGAVAALIRSVGTGHFRLPHTGNTHYDKKVPKIPYAALSIPDAELLHRLVAGGKPVKVRLRLGAHYAGEVASANVVGEIRGSDRPNEVVLIGAHLDSWDLGEGAIDDGAGIAIVLETARLIRALGVRPHRTIRVVLFMNEENGITGARAYAEAHRSELPHLVAAMEADSGAGRPLGFGVAAGTAALSMVRAMAAPLASLRAADVTVAEEEGADLIPLQRQGVPVLGMNQDMSDYFDWHHTAGDTLDKVDPDALRMDVIAFAEMVHALGESQQVLPRGNVAPASW